MGGEVVHGKRSEATVETISSTANAEVVPHASSTQQAGDAALHRMAAPKKYALIGGGGLKGLDENFELEGFSQQVSTAIKTFRADGFDTSVLFGDVARTTNAQKSGMKTVEAAYGKPLESFTPETIATHLDAIAKKIQPGDEVVLMIDSHGYTSRMGTADPGYVASGDYVFETGLPSAEEDAANKAIDAAYDQHSGPQSPESDAAFATATDALDAKQAAAGASRQVQLSDLAPYRDRIEQAGGKVVVLMFTCSSEGAMSFATDKTTVISETGYDKGEGVFSAMFLKYVRKGMTPEQAFAAAKSHMKKDAIDDAHISTSGVVANDDETHSPEKVARPGTKPSGFRF